MLFGRHATSRAAIIPQSPRQMTRVHRAINSVFIFSVRCAAVRCDEMRSSEFTFYRLPQWAPRRSCVSSQRSGTCNGFEEKRS